MKFVIGIGNPGREYIGTRHNAGFAVLDRMGRERQFRKSASLTAEIAEAGDWALVRPMTFVNRTGETLRALVQKKSAKPEALLIVCDDVNLDFGKLRLRPSGSAGGHHGLESAIEALGTEDFARLRVGVRTETMPGDLTDFVLGKFSKEEQKRLEAIVDRAVKVCGAWIEKGIEAAQAQLSQLQSIQDKE